MTRDHYIPVCSATDCSNQASFKNVPAGTVRSGQAVLVRTAGITNTPVCCDCEPAGCGFASGPREAGQLIPAFHVDGLAGGSTTRAMVTSTEVTMERGLFNPYTTGGYIIVDGMVVSGRGHSDCCNVCCKLI